MDNKKSGLQREDWINAGMAALYDEGVNGVKVDRLAKKLKITRGSFYWHFKDQGDLLSAMMRFWGDTQKDNLNGLMAQNLTGRDRIHAILQHIGSKDSEHDVAMRLWAYENIEAARAVEDIDQRRLAFVEETFCDAGFDKSEARFRAHVLYYFQLGDQLSRKQPNTREREKHFDQLNALLVDD